MGGCQEGHSVVCLRGQCLFLFLVVEPLFKLYIPLFIFDVAYLLVLEMYRNGSSLSCECK